MMGGIGEGGRGPAVNASMAEVMTGWADLIAGGGNMPFGRPSLPFSVALRFNGVGRGDGFGLNENRRGDAGSAGASVGLARLVGGVDNVRGAAEADRALTLLERRAPFVSMPSPLRRRGLSEYISG